MKRFLDWMVHRLIVAGSILTGVAVAAALANYTMTQGAGTTFGSIVVSTVHYAQQLLCDPTTPSQCTAVSAAGAAKVDGSAVTQPVSMASSQAVDGWDVTKGAKGDAAYTGSGSASVIAILKGIYTNVVAAIPAGTNFIGQIGHWVGLTTWISGTTSAMTGTTSTQLIAAVASKKLYITNISCVNSHATVGTFVTVQDGSGGTALATLTAASAFGGDEKQSIGPLFSTTSGNGLFVADVTTGANVICNASGFAQ